MAEGDSWENYAAEREELGAALQASLENVVRYHHEFPQLPEGTQWQAGDQWYSDAPPRQDWDTDQLRRALAMLTPPEPMVSSEMLLDMSIVEESPEMRGMFPEAAARVDAQRAASACPVCGQQVTQRTIQLDGERGAGVLLQHGEASSCWIPEEEARRG